MSSHRSIFVLLFGIFVNTALANIPTHVTVHATDAEVSADGEPAHVVVNMPTERFARPPESGVAEGGPVDSNGMNGPSSARAASVFVLSNSGDAEGDTPTQVEFTPDGTQIVVSHLESRNLIVFDANTRAFVREIMLSGSPQGFDISADGATAVTANVWEDTASIVDLTTGTETTTVPVGDQPGIVYITPDGTTAIVGNTVSGDLSVIDIATATEVRRISGAGFNSSVSFNFESGAVVPKFGTFIVPDNSTVLLGDVVADQIKFFDIGTGSVNALASDDSPRGVAVTEDGLTAVVAHTGVDQTISLIDVTSQMITKTIAIGAAPWGPISIRDNAAKAAVAVQNAVRVVDLATDAVSGDLSTASVNQLVNSTDGKYALGVGFYGALVTYANPQVINTLNNIVSTAIGASSSTDLRSAMVANLFGEDMLVVNTDGASGGLEAAVMSGPLPEADKTRVVAVTPDGATAVTTNIFSDTASIIDVASGTVLGVVDVGDRPAEVAITPDGTTAVVANLDSSFASVIDIATQTVTNVNISRRAGELEIAPDGSFAYLAVVADGDGVWRINLSTLSATGGKLLTGDMGGAGFLYSQVSGLTLSHDGATLVTCNSFTDDVSIIDTATWSELARVTVGDFPVRATFSADDATIYVSNKNVDTVSVVNNAGAGSTVTSTITVGDQPFEMVVTADNSTLYVLNFGDKTVGRVDLPATTMSATVALPNSPAGLIMSADESKLFAPTGNSSVTLGPGPRVSTSKEGGFTIIDRASFVVAEEVPTGEAPARFTFNEATQRALIASPTADGVVRIDLDQPCVGDLNGDSIVDLTDLALLLSDFDCTSGCAGDVDGDDDTDLTDLAVLLANFDLTCP